MTNYLNSTFNFVDHLLVSALDELPLWSAPFGLKLFETIKLKKNIKVLDIGFGTGFPILEVAMRVGDTCKVYGIDPWKSAIERASQKMQQYEINNVELIEGVAENIPLPDNSIDLIISNNGINNVEDLSKTLSECKRVAKPGAQVVATVNLETTMAEFYDVFKEVLHKMGLHEEIEKMQDHIYLKRKPLSELINLFESKGFKIKNINHDEFKFRYVDGTTMLNHYFIRLAFMDSWKEVVPDVNLTDVFKKVEKRLNRIAEEKSELVLTIPFVVIDAKWSSIK